jgi:uncharacterized glyoxalase superfamily protein PhnB
MIGSDFRLSLNVFVAQGRERETADFYKAAFGAEEVNSYEMLRLMMIEMQIGQLGMIVCGSDPVRESAAGYIGPFHPKVPGAVSSIFQLTVTDVRAVTRAALDAGGAMRDELQLDGQGRIVASIFDPAGHVWVLIEAGGETEEQAVE